MSRVVRAVVITSSSEDVYARVKLKAIGIWEESPLVESVNMIPLSKGDVVFVDVSNGFNNPLIIGRAASKLFKPKHNGNGSVLFQSSNGNDYTVCFTKDDTIELYNSKGLEITIKGNAISISAGGGNLSMDGEVSPTGQGPFCAMKVCPFTGAVHVGNKVSKV